MLAEASLEATNLDAQLPLAGYGVHCAWLRASVLDSELIAKDTELRPLIEDEAFFAANAFRTSRFHVILPESKVLGLDYGELFRGKSYQARSIHFSRPFFDALVNRDKPSPPFVKPPLMVHEALASIRQPLHLGSLSLTNGTLKYCERLAVGADPAVLTFGAVSLDAEGIANRGQEKAAILLRARGDLMNAGTLWVLMSIPIAPLDFSLHYSGSLSAMALTRLNEFLGLAEHTRIKSGSAQDATFDIAVSAGHAHGHVRAIYKNLEIALLDKHTGTEQGLANRVSSLVANVLKIRNANAPEGMGSRKEGEVNYTRKPDEEFQEFLWFALRTGVLDVISH